MPMHLCSTVSMMVDEEKDEARPVVKVYFLGLRNPLKMLGTCFLWGPQCYKTAPGRSYLRHRLLLAVCMLVVKGHTLWHMYTANNVTTARNKSSNGTADSVHVSDHARNMHSGLILFD